MKRYTTILLVLIMVLTFCAYGKSLGTYYFDWTLVVDYHAEGKEWISYNWADGTRRDDVKIHK